MDTDIVLLTVSEVKNRELVVPGADCATMRRIHSHLREKLFNAEIPHYRPIGAYIKGTYTSPGNVVERVLGVNKSYMELWRDLRSMIMAEGGGYDLGKGLNQRPDESPEFAYIFASETDSAEDRQFQFCGDRSRTVHMLVQGEPIVSVGAGCQVKLVLYKGTGIIDFPEAEKILRRRLTGGNEFASPTKYVPFRAVYSLYNEISIKPYQDKDGDVLRFMYKQNVNEDVLTRIIQSYAQSLWRDE